MSDEVLTCYFCDDPLGDSFYGVPVDGFIQLEGDEDEYKVLMPCCESCFEKKAWRNNDTT